MICFIDQSYDVQWYIVKTFTYVKVNHLKFVEFKVVPIQSENVILAACTDRVKPIAYGPKDKYTSIGQNITFTCRADFGCNSDSARDISWYDDHWNTMNHSSLPRYKVSKVER